VSNVLFVSHTAECGGAERVLVSLMAELKGRSFALSLAVPSEGPLLDNCEDLLESSNTHGLNFASGSAPFVLALLLITPRFLRAEWRLWKFAGATQPDIIHANSLFAALLVAIPAHLRKTPVVWHMHDIILPRRMPSWLPPLLAHFVSRIVCVSNAVRVSLLALGVPCEKCGVNFDAAPTPRVPVESRTSLRGEYGIPIEAPLVGTIGRLAHSKGQHSLIAATSRIVEEFPEARFVVVGEVMHGAPSYEREYEKMLYSLAREKPASSGIIFTGQREDVEMILSELDVFVHSPVAPDPCPLVISEAMRLGCQIVATETGGIPEQLNGGCGVLVRPDSPDELAEAIVGILAEDPKDREARASRARERAAAVFSQQARAECLVSVYREVRRARQRAG